ncbi:MULTISPECIES: hypothetical protein [Kitasatospora]|uniref:Uncharacterized protein n=1 Tax=Kitasatospora cystarginea TaxID=58350 RepID=A0ABP5RQE3_9ACTN
MRSLRWLRVRHSLLLVCAGWACTVPVTLADDDIRDVVSQCHDSPGAPFYVLPLAWAGLVLGIAAICLGGWQLVTVLRDKSRRLGPGHALLCAVLPLAVVAALVQAVAVQVATHDTGPQRNHCAGSARLIAEFR